MLMSRSPLWLEATVRVGPLMPPTTPDRGVSARVAGNSAARDDLHQSRDGRHAGCLRVLEVVRWGSGRPLDPGRRRDVRIAHIGGSLVAQGQRYRAELPQTRR